MRHMSTSEAMLPNVRDRDLDVCVHDGKVVIRIEKKCRCRHRPGQPATPSFSHGGGGRGMPMQFLPLAPMIELAGARARSYKRSTVMSDAPKSRTSSASTALLPGHLQSLSFIGYWRASMKSGLHAICAKRTLCKCCGALAAPCGVVDFHKNCEIHRRPGPGDLGRPDLLPPLPGLRIPLHDRLRSIHERGFRAAHLQQKIIWRLIPTIRRHVPGATPTSYATCSPASGPGASSITGAEAASWRSCSAPRASPRSTPSTPSSRATRPGRPIASIASSASRSSNTPTPRHGCSPT